MSRVYLDIETLPADWTHEQILSFTRTKVPGSYKKPETIEAWIVENVDECHASTALDWRHARICCLGTAIDHDEPTSIFTETCDTTMILDHLLSQVEVAFKRGGCTPTLIGHNILGFDLPRLILHAARQRHRVLGRLPRDRFSRLVVDTQSLACGPDPRALPFVRLGDLATFLGVGEKTPGMDGSKVWEAFQQDRYTEIESYCRQDVALCRAVHLALNGDYPPVEF